MGAELVLIIMGVWDMRDDLKLLCPGLKGLQRNA